MLESDPSPAVLQTIAEAVTWCHNKPFRSPELDPAAILNIPSFSSSLESVETWIEKKVDCYGRAISWLGQTRAELLRGAGVEILSAADALSKSRLLTYQHLETVDDGAAEAASMGFYDLEDAPPWDTWCLYANRSVFCCVPEFAITRAQNGIDANPVDCIQWADWSKLSLIHKPENFPDVRRKIFRWRRRTLL